MVTDDSPFLILAPVVYILSAMPKCGYISCDQTAHYGRQFNRPIYCKLHMQPDCGSVKKKCAQLECINAAFIGDLCSRCNSIHSEIEKFRDLKLSDLEAKCRSEAVMPAQITVPQVAPIATAQVRDPLKPKKTVQTKRELATQPALTKPQDGPLIAPIPPAYGSTTEIRGKSEMPKAPAKRPQTPAARPRAPKSQLANSLANPAV